MSKRFLYILAYLLSCQVLFAQSKLQRPEEFLGYALGERFTSHHKVLEYYQHVAANSDQVLLQQYGETYEKRPLIVAFVSTQQNLQNLDAIRKSNLMLTGLEPGTPTAATGSPAIIWLSYNVHGNESVSTEAALATLYALTNKDDAEKQGWLQNTVVIMDPCLNPDGRERYVSFYKQTRSAVPNPQPDAREHHEPWPGGRANHYLFDLNRDWAWQTQIESQQRIALYNQWMPHVHVDFHEQGLNSPYYFAPAAEPLHEVITPWQREFQNTIGVNHAKYFDKNNWLYFTRERFDLFYPSYGDTYPTYNGAIGMTYEQGGSGRAGLAVLTDEKDTLTLADRILHHYTSGISTIEVTSKNADRVVSEFARFFNNANNSPAAKYKSYVVSAKNDPAKISALKQLLDKNGIRYGQAASTRSLKGFNYGQGKENSFAPTTEDLVISAYQPRSNMVTVLFEPKSKLSDSITYDITAWSIPYMYDLETYATSERIAVKEPKEPVVFAPINVIGKPYAYVAPWKSLQDVKWLSHLLKNGIKVRYAEEAFEIQGKTFGVGSLIITRTGNEGLGDEFDRLVASSANEMQRQVVPVTSGMVTKGKDFGSGGVRFIKAPRIGLMAGEGVSSLAFGEAWHFFEQQIQYPVTVLETGYFKSVNINDYDVLVFPGGSYNILDEALVKQLGAWVEDGGKMILLESAIASFADAEGFSLSKYLNDEEKKEADAKKEELSDRLKKYKNREREGISDIISGGIVKLQIDNTHPLAFGYPNYYYSLKNNATHYAYLKDGWNVGIIKDKSDLVSGFGGYKAKEKLANSMVFGVEEKGAGNIVYMVDNPLFRAFWHNGKLLFGNAVFMVGQ